jgi:hypothetical protein
MMRAFDQGASHTVLLCHPSCVLGVAWACSFGIFSVPGTLCFLDVFQDGHSICILSGQGHFECCMCCKTTMFREGWIRGEGMIRE